MPKNASVNFSYTPFGDETILKSLLENWHRLDPRVTECGFNEDILVTFIDLEALIARSGLSKVEIMTINGIIEGATPSDIAESYGGKRQAINGYYRRAVTKIAERAKKEWAEYHGQ